MFLGHFLRMCVCVRACVHRYIYKHCFIVAPVVKSEAGTVNVQNDLVVVLLTLSIARAYHLHISWANEAFLGFLDGGG